LQTAILSIRAVKRNPSHSAGNAQALRQLFKGIPHFKPWKIKLLTENDRDEVLALLDHLPDVLEMAEE
jgi:hypothetical protein